jgi:apolipoprotein N-acyltransferase
MGDLIKLVLALADGAARRPASTCLVCAAVGGVMAAGCAIAALACALAALWIYALPHVGTAGAPLVVAGVLVTTCLVMLLVVRYGLAPRQPAPATAGPAVLLADAARLIQDHKGPVLMTALLAGLIAGRSEK